FETLAMGPYPDDVKTQMTIALARASGAVGMVGGQAIDLSLVSSAPSLEALENMHQLKTGAMIQASIQLGALAAGANADVLSALIAYGKAIGLAFQVQDDILDVVADTSELGKHQGADAALDKPTYVSLLGLEGARCKLRSG
ncbi:MAG: polyprenyl synthetase family protein, partial [Granulosicoccaceae bacterium]